MDRPDLPSIKEFLSEPLLKDYLSNHYSHHVNAPELIVEELIKIETFMKRRLNPGEEEQVLVESLKIIHFFLLGWYANITKDYPDYKIVSSAWEAFLDIFTGMVVSCNYWKQTEAEQWLLHKELVAVINSLNEKDIIENLLLDTADCNSNLLTPPPNIYEEENRSRALLLVKAFPALLQLKEPKEIFYFLFELRKEIGNLPELICEACHCQGQPLPLLLIGGLPSLKQWDYHTWNKVKDDLVKIKESAATNKHMQRIFNYCYNDLPHFLKKCFLYLACYPIGYEIPATSLTQLWIAEEFVTPQQGETIEETSHKYLEQLVQRSLVCVSKRSLLGTIKYCRVHRSIHELVIQRSNLNKFLVTNPSGRSMSGSRLAVHNDYKESDGFFTGCKLQSIFAFDYSSTFDSIDTRTLKVLELRKCSTQFWERLEENINLRYVGLRGTYICDIPPNPFCTFNLKTLDVRDTGIDILPESIWNIPELRHVYVNSGPNIKGPPSKTYISDLQTLKTVGIHESWLENFPQCLINLRKLALLNRDNSYWKPISNLLSHMVNLLSMTIIGDIVPSEFVDLRAFPNLETVKSIKYEGEWKYCKKLIIDNVKFPTNLTKLTLTKSGLKEDPMPRLEKLEALKFLSLQDGAFIGMKMVCSENGFPQLQFLELKKLEKLENWEVNPRAMPQLTKLSVFQCLALKKLSDLEHVPNIDTDIK